MTDTRYLKSIRYASFLKILGGSDHAVMVLIAILVGVLSGYGAIVFRYMIRLVQWLFFGPGGATFLETVSAAPLYVKILAPALGGLIIGPIIFFIAREARGPGVTETMEAVALRGGRIRKRVSIVKILTSAVCIGSGGSAGREGPIVQIGAGIGSMCGQLLHVSTDRLRTLVACGAAGGIAATFNAPIAGVMFAMEIILGNYGISSFSPIVVSSVVATAVSRAHLGNYPALVVAKYNLVASWELAPYMVLGVFCGAVAVLFTVVLHKTEDAFSKLKMPDYLKPAVGGLLVGLIGIVFPEVFGVGYDVMDMAVWERLPWFSLFGLVFLKIAATSFTIGSGGAGGVVVPSLYIGAMAGGFFGWAVHGLFPGAATSGAYSLVGMGALLAGTSHGPMHAILLLFELTGNYQIILPLMLSCFLSYIVASEIRKGSIFTLPLLKKGIDLQAGREANIMRYLKVRDAMARNVETIPQSLNLREFLKRAMASKHTNFPVVDDEGRLAGIVDFQDFKDLIYEEALGDLIVVRDIVTEKVLTVTEDESLETVLERIGFRNIEQLPVVDRDDPGRIVGVISRHDIFSAYNKTLVKRSPGDEIRRV
ncbi:MAG TPA: chloride channel protein [Syntrophales bacterium]|nr:chloride channel protein [Syntrophales bacterium]